MKYKETLDYLYSQLPMFHRVGAAAYKANLGNTYAICRLLGNPENKFRSIHVAGTNGKGSSSHMLAAVLQAAGYKTGLYTSPHLKDFRERIRINGKPVPQKKVTEFVRAYRRDFEKIRPSFFEWTVGLAFSHFAEEEVDVAVIEVGLGGRLDSTNVITPLASLITNISFDHMALLGDTLPRIAAEKAGIIKPGIPVIVSQEQRGIKNVFTAAAKKNKATLEFASRSFVPRSARYSARKGVTEYTFETKEGLVKIASDLTGTYQAVNMAGVLATIRAVASELPVTTKAIGRGLRHVKKLTGLRGRWEVIGKRPRIICDTGHNEDGIRQVLACVDREYAARSVRGRLHAVLGAVNDKDMDRVFSLVKKNRHFAGAAYYFCKPGIPRGMDAAHLQQTAKKHKLEGRSFGSVRRALQAARKAARPRELVFVGGSTFTVAEVL
jgi:dihydrofolate synthase / folylpolyglutamate synthase